MFRSMFPIISTGDLERALRFYRDLLGGTVSFQFPAEGPAVYVSIDVGQSPLGIGADPDIAGTAPSPRFALWVYAADCVAAVEHLRRAGVRIVEEPTEQPWGERVARVHDPDGNLVIIGSPG